MNDKLIDLEIRLTHQENHIEELDKIIYQQQKAIDDLTAQVAHLIEKMKNANEANILSPTDEKPPPHY